MGPHTEGEKQAPNTLIKQWGKKGRETEWWVGGTASERSLHTQEMIMLKKMLTTCKLLQCPLVQEHKESCHMCIARQC